MKLMLCRLAGFRDRQDKGDELLEKEPGRKPYRAEAEETPSFRVKKVSCRSNASIPLNTSLPLLLVTAPRYPARRASCASCFDTPER